METFTPEMKQLLLSRLEGRYEQGRLHGIYRLDPANDRPRRLSPEQMIQEARKGTAIGEEILMAEKQFMEELKRRIPR